MSLQTYHPPQDVVHPIVTSYGQHSIQVTPEGAGSEAPLVIQTPGEPTWILQGSEATELGGASGVHIGPAPEATSHTISYGYGGDPWYAEWVDGWDDGGMPWALQLGLVLLGVWLAMKVIGLVFQGVGAVLSFVWSIVTLPFRLAFRLVRGAGRLVFGAPRRVARAATGSAALLAASGRAMGRTVSRGYESFADAYNRADLEPGPALRKAKASLLFAQRKVEAAGRRVGHRLGRLGHGAVPVGADAGSMGGTYGETPGFHLGGGAEVRPEFPGYKILSELPRGGSGARLYLARPRREHARRLAERGVDVPAQVVIKWFSLQAGAHMSGILREGRALDAAKQLGQVVEHVSGQDGLFYVMPYVAGETLDQYIATLHGLEQGHLTPSQEPLRPEALREVLHLSHDLLAELERFHAHGLWHKDIKPGNLIVHEGRMRVVDLGLLTPLASALTLTTHGTEYYRDPEMVRLAMRGAQVRDVDAAKFDLYSAGAVLFSMLEGTFPAHGNLSRLTRPCPPALGWIVRRAMAEHDSRYASAQAMRADLAYLLEHKHWSSIKPKDLPSWGHSPEPVAAPASVDPLLEALESPSAQAAVTPPKRRKRWGWKCKKSRMALWVPLVFVVLLGLSNRSQPRTGFAFAQPSGPVVEVVRQAASSPFASWSARNRADWARQQVDRLLAQGPEGRIEQVYLHGLPQGRDGRLMGSLLSKTMASEEAQALVVQPSDPEAQRWLPLAASASHLLDPLPRGEQPATTAQIQFFLEHPEVQAILDLQGGRELDAPRMVISPLIGPRMEQPLGRSGQ